MTPIGSKKEENKMPSNHGNTKETNGTHEQGLDGSHLLSPYTSDDEGLPNSISITGVFRARVEKYNELRTRENKGESITSEERESMQAWMNDRDTMRLALSVVGIEDDELDTIEFADGYFTPKNLGEQ